MSVLGWVFAIISVIGVAGFIALAVFAPLLARELLGVVLDVLHRLLKTRAGVCALTAAACLGFGFYYFDYQGAQRVRQQWWEANAAAAEQAAKRDAAIASNARAKDDKATAAESETEKANAEARNAYIADLEKRAASVCVDTDADIRRLPRSR